MWLSVAASHLDGLEHGHQLVGLRRRRQAADVACRGSASWGHQRCLVGARSATRQKHMCVPDVVDQSSWLCWVAPPLGSLPVHLGAIIVAMPWMHEDLR